MRTNGVSIPLYPYLQQHHIQIQTPPTENYKQRLDQASNTVPTVERRRDSALIKDFTQRMHRKQRWCLCCMDCVKFNAVNRYPYPTLLHFKIFFKSMKKIC